MVIARWRGIRDASRAPDTSTSLNISFTWSYDKVPHLT